MAGKILESGERELACMPPRWMARTAAILLATTVPILLAVPFLGVDRGTMAFLYIFVGIAAFYFLLQSASLRWRLMVTDRRILIRDGAFRRQTEDIPRHQVQSARTEAPWLLVEAAGRAIKIYGHPFLHGRVIDAINSGHAPHAHPAGLFGGLLEAGEEVRLESLIRPGETLLLREGRSIMTILAWMVAPALPLVTVSWLISNTELFNQFTDVLILVFGALLALFLFLGGLQFLIDFSFVGLYFNHWRLAVTDQRVLLWRGLLGTRHDEMARHEINNCLYDKAGGRIVLTGGNRELAIPCNKNQARRILAALGHDEALA